MQIPCASNVVQREINVYVDFKLIQLGTFNELLDVWDACGVELSDVNFVVRGACFPFHLTHEVHSVEQTEEYTYFQQHSEAENVLNLQ